MAANMIGVNKGIIAFGNDGGYTVMFNPAVIKKSGPSESEDGCLSHDGARRAKRRDDIKVRHKNRDFQVLLKTFTGFSAQIIRREPENCGGIII